MANFVKFIKSFDRFDFGWLILSLGMAIGSGIVIVPVVVGANGFFPFLVSVLIAYPGMFLFQKLYMHTLLVDAEAKTYSDVVQKILGKSWGGVLSIIYFLMMLLWVVVYSILVTKTLAKYFYQWGLSDNPNLQDSTVFSFVLLLIILILGLKSQKLLVKASSTIVFILILSIVVATFALSPYWSSNGVQTSYTWLEFVKNTVVMVPFSLTTILFIQSLNPMILSYREKYKNRPDIVEIKSVGIMSLAFIILVIIIGLYILSFSFVIPFETAKEAIKSNQTAFMILKANGQSDIINNILDITALLISITAILSPFLSILSGVHDGFKGVFKNIFLILNIKDIKDNILNRIVVVAIFAVIWSAVIFQIDIFKLVPFSGPIFSLIGCFIPFIAVYRVSELKKYKTVSVYYVLFVGLILMISPIINLF